MDRYRQQYTRYQRGNEKNCYQQKPNYSSGYKMDCDCNRTSNHYVCDKMPTQDCPGMGKDKVAGLPLAMAYVPWQTFGNLYEECEAVYHGTIFCDLDLDFYGMRCE